MRRTVSAVRAMLAAEAGSQVVGGLLLCTLAVGLGVVVLGSVAPGVQSGATKVTVCVNALLSGGSCQAASGGRVEALTTGRNASSTTSALGLGEAAQAEGAALNANDRKLVEHDAAAAGLTVAQTDASIRAPSENELHSRDPMGFAPSGEAAESDLRLVLPQAEEEYPFIGPPEAIATEARPARLVRGLSQMNDDARSLHRFLYGAGPAPDFEAMFGFEYSALFSNLGLLMGVPLWMPIIHEADGSFRANTMEEQNAWGDKFRTYWQAAGPQTLRTLRDALVGIVIGVPVLAFAAVKGTADVGAEVMPLVLSGRGGEAGYLLADKTLSAYEGGKRAVREGLVGFLRQASSTDLTEAGEAGGTLVGNAIMLVAGGAVVSKAWPAIKSATAPLWAPVRNTLSSVRLPASLGGSTRTRLSPTTIAQWRVRRKLRVTLPDFTILDDESVRAAVLGDPQFRAQFRSFVDAERAGNQAARQEAIDALFSIPRSRLGRRGGFQWQLRTATNEQLGANSGNISLHGVETRLTNALLAETQAADEHVAKVLQLELQGHRNPPGSVIAHHLDELEAWAASRLWGPDKSPGASVFSEPNAATLAKYYRALSEHHWEEYLSRQTISLQGRAARELLIAWDAAQRLRPVATGAEETTARESARRVLRELQKMFMGLNLPEP